jgi:alpha-N-arabinofuranosidase
MKKRIRIPALLLVSSLASVWAAGPTLTIEAGRPAAKVSPLLYGLMTEEINHCYDGGLYAELVQNRAFLDDAKTPVHWSAVQANGSAATISLDPTQPLNAALPVSLQLNATSASPTAPAGVANDGYWGIPVKPNTRYRAFFYAKATSGFSSPVTVAIKSDDGTTVYAKAEVPRLTGEWQSYSVSLTTGNDVTPTTNARLVLSVDHPGKVWFDLVSLFPPTWKNRSNGLRQDLMQMLVDLKPAFLRFPGGNYLEGDTIETRFDWKKTLGPVAQRAGHRGPWGYRSTDGMGMLEFLLWCEDMGAEPVLGIYAGYSLRGAYVKPGPALEPFIQDAFDEIEYVTGSATTKWGAQRAKDGHPAPFPLHYIEIGNEDFFDQSGSYDGRFAQFKDAMHKRYPNLKCISTVGNEQPADKRVHARKPDALDEHYYRSAADFLKDSPTHFDKYDRHGPEIFVGEWGAFEDIVPWDKHSMELPKTPNMKAALGDAAWMAAMERNSDIIVMHCYAPLFTNINPGASQWRPNLIGYDALRSYGSPSYYAIRLFSCHHGDAILKSSFDESAPPLHQTVTKNTRTGAIYLKIVNANGTPQPLTIALKGVNSISPTATAIALATANLTDTNSLDEPTKVAPVTTKVPGIKPTFTYTFPPYSITMLQLDAR